MKNHRVDAHYNSGLCLQKLGRDSEALQFFLDVIAIDPGFADAYYHYGVLLHRLNQLPAALQYFEKTIAIQLDFSYLAGTLLHTQMQLCRWGGLPHHINQLVKKIALGAKCAPPFTVLCMIASLSTQRQAATTWVNDVHPFNPALGPIRATKNNAKIKIGYFSADFYNHATAHLMAGLFLQHDREKFDVIAFSFGPQIKDAMSKKLSKIFDLFIDVSAQTDEEIAVQSRAIGVDIAVDLKRFTQNNRFGIFSYRAAPIQISYLGYPGTSGAPYIDYLIADHVLIPPNSARHYAEELFIYLTAIRLMIRQQY